MKVLVVDDEPLARQRMQSLLGEIELVEQVLLASNGLRALEICQQQSPQLVLLDISMPGMGGLEVAQHLAQMDKAPAIIFVTAFDDYAMEAFKVHAIDYLLKPVRGEKLRASIEHACQLNSVQMAVVKSQQTCRKNITAKICGNIQLIPVVDILYFLAEQKYVTVRHTGGETIIEDTLKELQAEFSQDFLRIHRNALVAKKFISGVHRDDQGHSYVTLNGDDKRLEISRRHLSEVKKLVSRL